MQITNNYQINTGISTNCRNAFVSFKSGELKEITTPSVINKLKKAVVSEFDITWLEGSYDYINKLLVPTVLQRIDSRIKDFSLNMIEVPSNQLQALLGEKGHCYNLSRLKGICIFAADSKDLGNCNIYNMQVVLVPNSIQKETLNKIHSEMLSQKKHRYDYLKWL